MFAPYIYGWATSDSVTTLAGLTGRTDSTTGIGASRQSINFPRLTNPLANTAHLYILLPPSRTLVTLHISATNFSATTQGTVMINGESYTLYRMDGTVAAMNSFGDSLIGLTMEVA